MIAQQLSLDDAMRARETGQERVLADDSDYREWAEAAIRSFANNGEPFSADSVRDLIGDPPASVSPNLIGALFQAALKRSEIRWVSFTRSPRVMGHGNKLGLYVGARFTWP